MTAQDLFTTMRNVANIINELEAAGMRIELGGDFTVYRRLRLAQKDRSGPFPMFDVTNSYVDASNAFWVVGFNEHDEVVHTQAIRRLDLRGTTLASHLDTHRHKYITPGTTPDPDRTFFTPLSSLSRISGDVCYHGEFWLKGGDGGHRNQGFTALLSRIVFEVALRSWSPDFLFGFVPMPLAMKGIPVRYGYSRCEPGAWIGPNQEITSEETLVWMSRTEIEQFLETSPKALSQERRVPMRQELTGSISAVA